MMNSTYSPDEIKVILMNYYNIFELFKIPIQELVPTSKDSNFNIFEIGSDMAMDLMLYQNSPRKIIPIGNIIEEYIAEKILLPYILSYNIHYGIFSFFRNDVNNNLGEAYRFFNATNTQFSKIRDNLLNLHINSSVMQYFRNCNYYQVEKPFIFSDSFSSLINEINNASINLNLVGNHNFVFNTFCIWVFNLVIPKFKNGEYYNI